MEPINRFLCKDFKIPIDQGFFTHGTGNLFLVRTVALLAEALSEKLRPTIVWRVAKNNHIILIRHESLLVPSLTSEPCPDVVGRRMPVSLLNHLIFNKLQYFDCNTIPD